MVQLEIELTPLIVGFSCGTAIFLLHRLSAPSGRSSKEAPALDKECPSPVSEEDEPGPEPGLEAGLEAAAPAPARAWRSAAATAFALLVLLVALLAFEPQGPGSLTQGEVAEQFAAATDADEAALLAESETGVVSEEVAGAKPITLNLTRQTIVIQNMGDMVHYKSAYWGTIRVGTPAVEYKVVFDTGSGYLILPSTYCHSDTCRIHKRYRRSASSSARDIDFDGTEVKPGEPRDEMTISFGTGEVTGVLVEEVACLGGIPEPAPSNDSVAVATGDAEDPNCLPLSMIIATEMTDEPFRTFHFDGVMGLGLLGLSKAPRFSLIHNVAESLQGQGLSRTATMFSVFLGEHRRETSDITFGGYVQEHLQEEISWNSVLHPELGHWMLEVKSLRVDGELLPFCDEGCRAIVDTGTSLLAVPAPAFPQIHELLRHEVDPVHECSGPGPKLHIELEGLTLTLEPQDYSKLESSLFGSPPQNKIRFGAPVNESEVELEPEFCKPTLMSMDLPEPIGPKLFVLGEPVLRKYYTVFDYTELAPRIGFGKASHTPPSPEDYWEDDEEEITAQ